MAARSTIRSAAPPPRPRPGCAIQFTENWSAFAEYKGNYSFVDVDIDNGATLETDIVTNAINFGVDYRF